MVLNNYANPNVDVSFLIGTNAHYILRASHLYRDLVGVKNFRIIFHLVMEQR